MAIDQAIAVREATSSDDEAIYEVCRLATDLLRKVYRPRKNPGGPAPDISMARLVAEMDGVIVGTVRCRAQEDCLHIIGLMVHPDHWRKGVARRLTEELASIAKSRRVEKLSLFTIVETDNVPIFEKLGFKVIRLTRADDVESVSGAVLNDAYMESAV